MKLGFLRNPLKKQDVNGTTITGVAPILQEDVEHHGPQVLEDFDAWAEKEK